MARVKHTKSIEANPRGAKKQLKLISKLQSRMKQKAFSKGVAGMKQIAKKNKGLGKKVLTVEAADAVAAKRRWRPGTVAKREIRKLSRTTNLLFPKASFCRVVREICQDRVPNGHEMRFTKNSIKAIQEAAEVFVTETFHKADLARQVFCL